MNNLKFAVLILFLIACSRDVYLRGEVETSDDGLTYFSLVDDNGGSCKSVLLDGRPWPHKIGERGRVEPGAHEIDCNGVIGFDIPKGVIFKFDYWGP
ncbi:MAG: hypothetical protein AAF304_03335 [Pseudomonadota bacterium]